MHPRRRLPRLAILLLLTLFLSTSIEALGQESPLPTPTPVASGSPWPVIPGPDAGGPPLPEPSLAPSASPAKAPSPLPSDQASPGSKRAPSASPSTPPGVSPTTSPRAPYRDVDSDGIVERPGGQTVTVRGKELFRLYYTSKLMPLDRRVARVSRSITRLMDQEDLDLDAFRVLDDPKTGTSVVLYQDRYLFFLMPEDSPFVGLSPNLLAVRYVEMLRNLFRELAAEREQALREKAVTVGLEGLVAIPLCLLLCFYLLRLLEGRIHALEGSRIRPLKVHNAVLLPSSSLATALVLFLRFTVFLLLMLALSLYLDYFLSFFPGAAEIRRTLLAQPATMVKRFFLSALSYMPNLIFLGFCTFFTRFALGLNNTVFDAMEAGAIAVAPTYRDFLPVYRRIVRYGILFFGLVLVLPNLPGYDLPIFKGLSIFAGVLISLGSVGALGNALAGISLLATRALKEGDRVKIGEHVGDVVEMTLATTRIRTISKQDVTLPNTSILQTGCINMTSAVKEAGSTIIYVGVTIGYDAHGDAVADLLCKAGAATAGVLADPAPFVLQKSLDDFYVTYHLGVHTRVPEETLRIISDLNANIRRFFDEAGVEIMSPHYRNVRDGNHVTIPDRYLASDYEAPTFRVTQVAKAPRPVAAAQTPEGS